MDQSDHQETIDQENSSEQQVIMPPSPDDQTSSQQTSSTAAKSYECTFCKRGFSNAQALGGHMNIHRKDKAKLKQSVSDHTKQRVADFPKMSAEPSPAASYSPMILPTINSLEGHNIIHKPRHHLDHHDVERHTRAPWPWFLIKKGDINNNNNIINIDPNNYSHVQLPLFSQAPSHNKDLRDQARVLHGEKGLQPADSELDLELRLGPEPQDSSSTAQLANATTRKFF